LELGLFAAESEQCSDAKKNELGFSKNRSQSSTKGNYRENARSSDNNSKGTLICLGQ